LVSWLYLSRWNSSCPLDDPLPSSEGLEAKVFWGKKEFGGVTTQLPLLGFKVARLSVGGDDRGKEGPCCSWVACDFAFVAIGAGARERSILVTIAARTLL
jgi:hypothetical protein